MYVVVVVVVVFLTLIHGLSQFVNSHLSFVFAQCLRRFVNEPGGRSSLYSTFSAQADLSLAAVINSINCPDRVKPHTIMSRALN
jgi:hypothetical protein